ncbi:Aste57867_8140 [Aphanomyces stellatus]|uniref:Aste57867_8140 protein n=1 Tax=Aphanomyces stellatus TaxID=120398 RepID=A0A485KJI2_9STRA|nr:hypothetical protein As57867_008110 [Aphanomyces stellatus]VFT85029.1 Aste57867_8140 [Aphanomyces stellatus]
MRIAPPIKVKSVVGVHEPSRWMPGKTYRDRIWSLEKGVLTMSTDNRFHTHSIHIRQGHAWHGPEYGFQVQTDDGVWLHAKANSKGVWAQWLQALESLPPTTPPQTQHPTKNVQFNDHISVRLIPAYDDDDYESTAMMPPEIQCIAAS